MKPEKLIEILNLPRQEKLELSIALCKNLLEEHQNDLSEEQIRNVKDRLEEAEIRLLDYR